MDARSPEVRLENLNALCRFVGTDPVSRQSARHCCADQVHAEKCCPPYRLASFCVVKSCPVYQDRRPGAEKNRCPDRAGTFFAVKSQPVYQKALDTPRKAFECTGGMLSLGTHGGFTRRQKAGSGTPVGILRQGPTAQGTGCGISRRKRVRSGTAPRVSRQGCTAPGTPVGFSRRTKTRSGTAPDISRHGPMSLQQNPARPEARQGQPEASSHRPTKNAPETPKGSFAKCASRRSPGGVPGRCPSCYSSSKAPV